MARTATICGALLIAGAVCAPVAAQSINIDIGFAENGPSDSYRGVGLPGHWHSFAPTTWGEFFDLADLYGNPTAVRVRQIGGTEIVQTPLGGPLEPQGGDAILLGDALVTHAVENCLFFENLQNGRYEVISYAWMPTVPTTLNHIWIDDHPIEPNVGGLWPGFFKQGTVYARHEFEVVAGIINMHSGIPSGGPANPGAALNGIQLRCMVPEPPLFVDDLRLEWLASLDAIHYDVVRGDLATLRSTGGDFSASVEACVANDWGKKDLGYAIDPPTGEGDWFLVRGSSAAASMTWNSTGPAQVGNRDFELAFACP